MLYTSCSPANPSRLQSSIVSYGPGMVWLRLLPLLPSVVYANHKKIFQIYGKSFRWACIKLDPRISSRNWIFSARLDHAFYLNKYGSLNSRLPRHFCFCAYKQLNHFFTFFYQCMYSYCTHSWYGSLNSRLHVAFVFVCISIKSLLHLRTYSYCTHSWYISIGRKWAPNSEFRYSVWFI